MKGLDDTSRGRGIHARDGKSFSRIGDSGGVERLSLPPVSSAIVHSDTSSPAIADMIFSETYKLSGIHQVQFLNSCVLLLSLLLLPGNALVHHGTTGIVPRIARLPRHSLNSLNSLKPRDRPFRPDRRPIH